MLKYRIAQPNDNNVNIEEDVKIVGKVCVVPPGMLMDKVHEDAPASQYLGDTYTPNYEKLTCFLGKLLLSEDLIISAGPDLRTIVTDIDKRCHYIHISEDMDIKINDTIVSLIIMKNRGETITVPEGTVAIRYFKGAWTLCENDGGRKVKFTDFEPDRGIVINTKLGGMF